MEVIAEECRGVEGVEMRCGVEVMRGGGGDVEVWRSGGVEG